MQTFPEVAVGEQFLPVDGESLLNGRIKKENPFEVTSDPDREETDITNGEFLSLMLSAQELEALGGIGGDKYYDTMHVWLQKTKFQTKTPSAILAKCQRTGKKYKDALKKYNRRPTENNHQDLYRFLAEPLVWGEQPSSSEEDNEDIQHADSSGSQFTKIGSVVVVAFAEGVWL